MSEQDKLDGRKIKILEAIINDYIASAEPIGSRTIARKYDLGVSSATIRNEMSDLEQMGYILQPHASSGRVPSDKGYRLYVDEVMPKKSLNQTQQEYLEAAITSGLSQIDSMMRDVARAITHMTNYTTVAAEPMARQHKIKHIQLVPVDGYTLALMLITDLKAVKNHIINLPVAISPATASRMSAELTRLLSACCSDDICVNNLYFGMLQHRFTEMGFDVRLARPIFEAIYSALDSADNVQVYTSGMKNILDFPEFADLDKARAVVGALEEKEGLLSLLSDNSNEPIGNIQVIIGTENQNDTFKNCSVIKAKIRIKGGRMGNIAIIGPTRMDYSQVIMVLDNLL